MPADKTIFNPDSGGGAMEPSFPSASNVKEEIREALQANPPRDYADIPNNHADNDGLVEAFRKRAFDYREKFVNQPERSEALTDKLSSADGMYRMTKRKTKTVKGSVKHKQDTLANTTSHIYYEMVELISAGQNAVIFGDDTEIPSRYDPDPDSFDYTSAEGEEIAKADNLLFAHSWYQGKWADKCKRGLKRTTKNSMCVWSLQWEYETREVPEKVPGYYDADGKAHELSRNEPPPKTMYRKDGSVLPAVYENGAPAYFVFARKRRVVKDRPELRIHKPERCLFDLSVEEDDDCDIIQKQDCFIVESEKPYSKLLSGAKSGLYLNIDRLNELNLVNAAEKIAGDNVDDERDGSADEDRSTDIRGNIKTAHVWMRFQTTREDARGNVKHDPDAVPEIWEGVFSGDLNSDPANSNKPSCVCHLLRRNPNHHNRIPYRATYSHDDERGGVRLGYADLVECIFELLTTRQNQWSDNIEEAVRGVWLWERGNVLNPKDMLFARNKKIAVRHGTGKTALTKVAVPDMTQQFVTEMNFLRESARQAVQVTDAYQGLFAGSRTTGTEYLGAKEQAMKPAIDHARNIANQLLLWIMDDHAPLWRQFGDPERVITVTDGRHELLGKAQPGCLYGMTQGRVTGIEKFQADLGAQQGITNLMNTSYFDRFAKYMGDEGGAYVARTIWKMNKLPDPEKAFPAAQKMVDAEKAANLDVRAIFTDPRVAMTDPDQLPKPGEDHATHLRILDDAIVRVKAIMAVDPEAYDPAVVPVLELYRSMHAQLQAQAQAQQIQQNQAAQAQNAAGQAQNQSMQPPGMEGEAAGDTLSGVTEQAVG